MTFSVVRLLLALALVGAFGCTCTTPTGDAGVTDGGRVIARAVEGGVEIVLEDLETPLRTLQVDVVLSGGDATDVVPAGPVAFNLLEAALDDGPRGDLTLVVADTRRLPLPNGPVARLVTGPGVTATLSNALAVDDDGGRRTLATGAD
jgi:hypothetical protein